MVKKQQPHLHGLARNTEFTSVSCIYIRGQSVSDRVVLNAGLIVQTIITWMNPSFLSSIAFTSSLPCLPTDQLPFWYTSAPLSLPYFTPRINVGRSPFPSFWTDMQIRIFFIISRFERVPILSPTRYLPSPPLADNQKRKCDKPTTSPKEEVSFLTSHYATS